MTAGSAGTVEIGITGIMRVEGGTASVCWTIAWKGRGQVTYTHNNTTSQNCIGTPDEMGAGGYLYEWKLEWSQWGAERCSVNLSKNYRWVENRKSMKMRWCNVNVRLVTANVIWVFWGKSLPCFMVNHKSLARCKSAKSQHLLLHTVDADGMKLEAQITCMNVNSCENNSCCLFTELWDEKTSGRSFLYKLMGFHILYHYDRADVHVRLWHTVQSRRRGLEEFVFLVGPHTHPSLRPPQPMMYNMNRLQN